MADELRLREKLSYGLGDFGYSLLWNVVGAFLLYYYTDVALLAPAAIGTLFLTSRLLDAGVDLGIGIWVDKTRSRWGRTRPFLLFTGPIFCALFILTFMVPPSWSDGARLFYAWVTFYLLGVFFSLGSVPISAMLPMLTNNHPERLQISSIRAGLSAVSVIVATAFTLPLVGLLGKGNEWRGFVLLSAIFATVALVAILNAFHRCRERVQDDTPPGFAVLPAVRLMFGNRAWIVTFIYAVLNFVRFGTMLSSTAFFAIEVLKAPWAIGILLPAVSGTLLIGAVIAPSIFRRMGIRNGCLAALTIAITLTLALPSLESQTVMFLVLFVASSLSVSVTMVGIFTMAADSVDWHEWKTGTRNEGLLSSGISLATKVGMALGTAAIAYTLAYADYHAGHVSEGARTAIRWSYYAWPIGVYLIQMVTIFYWPMDGLHDRIRAEIQARRTS
ncbi:MAG: glycoside-pentoside-hexuronide (GPH):cation symporter [Sphingomicrobium sp.]